MARLDKLLCDQGLGTRSDVKELVKRGRVLVNGKICLDPRQKVDPDRDTVQADGQLLSLAAFHYGMLNKPAGILTAAVDKKAKTVADLLPQKVRAMGLMPVGRLDKDARGLLLFTTDGPLAHYLLSPKRHVDKEYRVRVDGPLNAGDVMAFEQGLQLSDFVAKPAKLEILQSGPAESDAIVTINEGKFHQVKRMFLARGRTVLDLQRISFGSLILDPSLPEGGFRELAPAEVDALKRDILGEDA